MTATGEDRQVSAAIANSTTPTLASTVAGLSDVPPWAPAADAPNLKLRLLLPHVGVAVFILLLLLVDFLLYRRRNRLQLDVVQEKLEVVEQFPKRAISGVYRTAPQIKTCSNLRTLQTVTAAAAVSDGAVEQSARGTSAKQSVDATATKRTKKKSRAGSAKRSTDAAKKSAKARGSKDTAERGTDTPSPTAGTPYTAKGAAKQSTEDAEKGTAEHLTDETLQGPTAAIPECGAKQSTPDAEKGTAGIPYAAKGSEELQSTDTSPDSGNGSPPGLGEYGKLLRKKHQKKLAKRLKSGFPSTVAPSESALESAPEDFEDNTVSGNVVEGRAPVSLRRLESGESSWLKLPPIKSDHDHRHHMLL